ncbi:MAG: DUF4833 domain-containing protein [Sandaracinaceae bacterium]|nr:DUF4833 domain-containing protein [Sandaracinaceae bacterium]
MRRTRRGSWVVATLGVATLAAVPAAAAVSFGEHDVQTIFYISKSDDRNRVDYAIRLDQTCQPIGSTPIYAYWRRFEPGQPPLGDLNSLDERAYGISRQWVRTAAPNGVWLEMHLSGFAEQRFLVLVQRGGAGECHARAMLPIRSRDAYLDHIHVTLGFVGIDHVTLHGRDAATNAEVSESLRPPSRGPLGFGG